MPTSMVAVKSKHRWVRGVIPSLQLGLVWLSSGSRTRIDAAADGAKRHANDPDALLSARSSARQQLRVLRSALHVCDFCSSCRGVWAIDSINTTRIHVHIYTNATYTPPTRSIIALVISSCDDSSGRQTCRDSIGHKLVYVIHACYCGSAVTAINGQCIID